jgi:hypothetical protein
VLQSTRQGSQQAQLPSKFQEFDPTEEPEETRKPSFYKKDAILREGELIITRGGIEDDSDDWCVAEVTQVHQDRVQVNYFSTPTQNIENFKDSTELERKTRLAQAHFRKTWFHREGKHTGKGELTPPCPHDPSLRTWEGPLKVKELNEAVLTRDVKITAGGRLSPETLALALAVKLNLPHNVIESVEDENPAVNNSLFTHARHEMCDSCQRGRQNKVPSPLHASCVTETHGPVSQPKGSRHVLPGVKSAEKARDPLMKNTSKKCVGKQGVYVNNSVLYCFIIITGL